MAKAHISQRRGIDHCSHHLASLLEQYEPLNGTTSNLVCHLLCRRVTFWMNISLAVNIFLLAVKIYAFIASRSKAILASAADSLVDIASQLVIAYAEYKASFPTTSC